ncbi:MAG: hypothetical protein R3A13_11105 [Bdellovibrionota bacterium]
MENIAIVKTQIIEALRHPEADEGLFYRNFTLLHEEDERPPVVAEDIDILDALRELIREGRVEVLDGSEEPIFLLIPTH